MNPLCSENHAGEGVWQRQWPSESALSPAARTLLSEQSLTRVLKRFDADFSVRLLHSGVGAAGGLWQGWTQPEWGFTREVFLCLDGEAVVWARSLCAEDSAFWRGLLDCGTQPLGERLFDGRLGVERSPLEFAVALPFAEAAFQTAFAARRSLFCHASGEMLALAECFLPPLRRFLP